ncbi:hypothetical protein HDV00_007103 [Rhizophlyctis rosea]|nr:hypothetical protein HDV00_007103 [Rhizophlyctis rosea]
MSKENLTPYITSFGDARSPFSHMNDDGPAAEKMGKRMLREVFMVISLRTRIALTKAADQLACLLDAAPPSEAEIHADRRPPPLQVGCKMRNVNRSDRSTRILVGTQGKLINMLSDQKQLDKLTHIDLDEAHEMTELLLLLLCDVWKGKKHLHLLVTFATIDLGRMQDYVLRNAGFCPPSFIVSNRPYLTKFHFLQ